jgi:hypothetical protein
MTVNPMQSLCGARCRTTGEPCKNYKMANGRCRMHGGKSTGRPVIHGNFTKEALAERSDVVKLNREIRSLLREI